MPSSRRNTPICLVAIGLSNLIDRQSLPTNMSQVADLMVNAAMSAKEVETLIAVPSPLY